MRPRPNPDAPRPTTGAFTLLEVVIGLMVLSLFVGSIFTIIQTTLRATVEVESLQREHDRQRQMVDLMRETLGALPPGTSLNLRIVEAGDPPQQELEIRGAPNVFPFGGQGSSIHPTVLGLRPGNRFDRQTGEPLYELSLTRRDLLGMDDDSLARGGLPTTDGPLALDESGRPWLTILRDVRGIQWTFYRADRREWSDTWTRNTLPDLIKMEIWMADRVHPLTGMFNIPRPGDAAAVPDAQAELDLQSASQIDPVTGRALTPTDGPPVPAAVPEGGEVQVEQGRGGNRGGGEARGGGGREGRGGGGGGGGRGGGGGGEGFGGGQGRGGGDGGGSQQGGGGRGR